MNKDKIAIIGATGNVGRNIVEILLQRKQVNPDNIKLYASAKSAGQKLQIATWSYVIQDIADADFKDCYLALFATDSDISKHYIPKALAENVKVVDSSSAYRLDADVPLIVPPVNLHLVTADKSLYATANCLACPISVVLKPLQDYVPIHRVLVSTYQSTSGAGKLAMDELYQQTKAVYTGDVVPAQCFQRRIAFNVIPQVDKISEDGFTFEEIKIAREVQKIISPSLNIAATSVRVPVMIGHSISLAIEFSAAIKLDEVRKRLASSQGIQLSNDDYTTPVEVVGMDDVFVGRLREDKTVPHGILAWLASDNLRRGAALDVVEIAEAITHGLSADRGLAMGGRV